MFEMEERYFRNYLERCRLRALDALGGVCARCGFADHRALQIDHVRGGGTQEFKNGGENRCSYYLRVIGEALTGKYQCLCANCNWIKKWEEDESRLGLRVFPAPVPEVDNNLLLPFE
jgi:hypothetical protein